jgi:hypothetical protein
VIVDRETPARRARPWPATPVSFLVITRFAPTVPRGYLPQSQDGAVVDVRDLERLEHFPHAAVALPTGRTEERGFVRLPVFEVFALGNLWR